jgi:hypothetical protein
LVLSFETGEFVLKESQVFLEGVEPCQAPTMLGPSVFSV